MSTTTVRPVLYKYLLSDRALQILKDLRIRFSQVSVLNDVDEFCPLYKRFASREKTEAISREFLPKKYPSEIAAIRRKFPPEEADKWIDAMVSDGADNLEANFDKIVRDLYAKLDRDLGLLSVSATVTSKLMWSFYSDGGRGIVVEFDPNDPWFNNKTAARDSFRHLRQVQYVADRTPVDFLTAGEDEVLYTKTCEWEFENEWRIIRGLSDGRKEPNQDRYGKDIFLFEIPPSAIEAVVFGYRVTLTEENNIRKIAAANPSLNHVVFKRAVRNMDGQVEIVPAGTECLTATN